MYRMREKNVEFLTNVLYNSYNFEEETYNNFINGKDETLGLKNWVRKIADTALSYNNDNINVWLPIIVQAMNDYLDNCPFTPSRRQVIFEVFVDWCKEIANIYYDYDRIKDVIDDLIPPVYDPAIHLIKKMHGEGFSKKEISEETSVNTRTVWNNMRRLDIKNKGKLPPLRIGGQPVYVDIQTQEKEDTYMTGSRRQKRLYYSTPDTMHPFVMQYNVTQAMILLKSLYLYRNSLNEINTENGSEICYEMAIDAWCQLSDYGKQRIKDVFGNLDPGFLDFLAELGEGSDNMLQFKSEHTFLKKDSNIFSDEQLIIAHKSGAICRIIFEDKNTPTLYNQRIIFNNNTCEYYAFPQADIAKNDVLTNTNGILLNASEIKQIIEE